jgi:hypothetical protein
VSRFSKIGDMVSHAAVGQAITSALPADAAQAYTIGVFSLENGEELGLLTTRSMNREELDRALVTHGAKFLDAAYCCSSFAAADARFRKT